MGEVKKQDFINLRTLKSHQKLSQSQCYETRNQLQKKPAKIKNTWSLNSVPLNNKWFPESQRRKLKIHGDK